jgi:enolase
MNEVDGTPNKTNIGANAILAVSLAVRLQYHYYYDI